MMRPGSPRLKTVLKGTHFTTVDDIKANMMGELRHLTKDEFCKVFPGVAKADAEVCGHSG